MPKFVVEIVCLAEIEADSKASAEYVANEIACEIADAAEDGIHTHLVRETWVNRDAIKESK